MMAILFLILTVSCQNRRHPVHFEFDANPHGWYMLIFNVEGAGYLPVVDGSQIVRFANDRRLIECANDFEVGWAPDQFYSGGTNLNNSRFGFSGKRESRDRLIEYRLVFIGSREQLESAERADEVSERFLREAGLFPFH